MTGIVIFAYIVTRSLKAVVLALTGESNAGKLSLFEDSINYLIIKCFNQILKSPNPQIFKSSNPQILKSSNPQILKSSNPQILKSSHPHKIHRFTNHKQ